MHVNGYGWRMRMGMKRSAGGQSSFVSIFFCSFFQAADGGLSTMLRFLLITALLRQVTLDGLAKEMNDDVFEISGLSTATSWPLSSNGSVDIIPTQAIVLEKLTVARGTRAVFRCKVENIGVRTVVWRKEGEATPLAIGLFPFAADARITADFSIRTNEWMLIIDDVRSDDDGVYFCQISSKATRETYQRTQLNVKSVSIEGLEYVEWGGRAWFTCSATGRPDPPQSVDWFKNGRRMRSDADRGIAITKNMEAKMLVSLLTIENVRMSDAAEYTCQASSADHATVTLNVVRQSAIAEKMVSNMNCGKASICWTINTGLIYSLAIPMVIQIVTAALQNP